MKVYRLERRGIGPYVGRCGFNRSPRRLSRHKAKKIEHISKQLPERTIVRKCKRHWAAVQNNYLFGAPSREALKAYFRYNLQSYFAQGYKIRVYEVPNDRVLHMGDEVAFPVEYHKFKTVKKMKSQIP